jgi:DNA-binding CsgD family transcriptional regulator
VLALAVQADERDYAEGLVAEELALARRSGVPEVEGAVLRTSGLLARGDAAIELLEQSAALLAPTRARLEHARSLVELGAALRRAGRRGEAREHLGAGLELADACGADRLLARAREELHAAGARPRRTARSGVAALTPSELRVARRAADGRSNVEIAQELYVTTKTVETHLSAAYAKLGLSGRGARERLAELLP